MQQRGGPGVAGGPPPGPFLCRSTWTGSEGRVISQTSCASIQSYSCRIVLTYTSAIGSERPHGCHAPGPADRAQRTSQRPRAVRAASDGQMPDRPGEGPRSAEHLRRENAKPPARPSEPDGQTVHVTIRGTFIRAGGTISAEGGTATRTRLSSPDENRRPPISRPASPRPGAGRAGPWATRSAAT